MINKRSHKENLRVNSIHVDQIGPTSGLPFVGKSSYEDEYKKLDMNTFTPDINLKQPEKYSVPFNSKSNYTNSYKVYHSLERIPQFKPT